MSMCEAALQMQYILFHSFQMSGGYSDLWGTLGNELVCQNQEPTITFDFSLEVDDGTYIISDIEGSDGKVRLWAESKATKLGN